MPYHEILPKLKELAYSNHIAAEYEVHHFDMSVDVLEQMKRFVSLFNKYL